LRRIIRDRCIAFAGVGFFAGSQNKKAQANKNWRFHFLGGVGAVKLFILF
jgi:hypothetical protein